MSGLHIEAESVAQAAPEAVWALVSDATRYPGWGPWSGAGYQRPGESSPRGVGAVYWLRSERRTMGRHTTSVERVLEVDEGCRIAYTVVRGMPVRNYRGEVTLTAAPGGTRIRWTADFDSTLMGRIVAGPLGKFFPGVVSGLAAAATAAHLTD
jgi:uncharacterized protein YndB with AHSA1/START domain